MQLAHVNAGDRQCAQQFSDTEELVLDRLLMVAAELTELEVDRWFEDLEQRIGADDAQRFEMFRTQCAQVDRWAAVTIARLTVAEREELNLLIARHPHAYFPGFHRASNLRYACDLVEVGARLLAA